ncbi:MULTISPECIES: aldehyde dehydrogenase family protein [unclassified Sphingopyxis]|jgi:aldehyde dehydrogenase|uniref:aldehyde dehydrogenase family protein n=1 Tax=unclassified Sphingopyxis TaxID=2614943 RepID=UPI000730FC8A|nr:MULTISPECIES: aldehyde dehydrogenase family protein [unclassified Sphingopyxis]MBA4750798.1 aldehyde dehydrogenase [Sphingopyxis sp.]MBN8846049.1 aldehyde dehydrogenase [Sphingomonadales bacterium]KTE26994.1 aldehyde dehydrogenase [Sphingopyxis sp. H057]KTE54300.1 aldehyde dehydrogenase [Sphingopyxis sp. H073]KTE56621.1 aldehyde dehydrogenase [Sphingopyxis sp. H071]
MFEQAFSTINAAPSFRHRYDNFIGGRWSPPAAGEYFADTSPINGALIAEFALSTPEDVERALDAAHAAKDQWAKISPAERARLLNRIADRLEDNLELLAFAETIDNGKPIRETRTADVPLAIDHFRYFAGCIRAEEGAISTIDADTIAYHFREPLGVVGQIIPWNFPLLMAAWKIAPALAAGNCTVIKPASQTPLTLLMFAELTADILPPGVFNVVTGPGRTVGQAIAANPRIAKVSFTGETVTGKQIMHAAADHLIPQTMELGGKSPNIFMADVLDEEDAFFDKALEGFTLFAFNKGEVCTCPSRALIHESIFDRFIERAVARVTAIRQGDPLDPSVQIGAQASEDQLHKILGYIDIGKTEGAQCLTGGARALPGGELDRGYFVQPTVFLGENRMRIFQEEIFGPVLSVTTFKTVDEAIAIANDTAYGLGAGVWTRNGNTAYRLGRAIEAGRVWTNCYHHYPAHAAFGGYKASGFGRENHKMMLDHYQQTKNLLVSYDEHALGLF